MKLKFTLSAVSFALALVNSPVSAVEITDLGTLGGYESVAFGINDSDQVVGNSSGADFLWQNGQMTNLTEKHDIYYTNGINNAGQIAGAVTATDGIIYPAMFDSRLPDQLAVTILGSLGGVAPNGFNGTAAAINNVGQTVGYSYANQGFGEQWRHAFFADKDGIQDITMLHSSSIAYDINDSGTIVGSTYYQNDTPKAFLLDKGHMQDLSPFGSIESEAQAINNQGQVVGNYLAADLTNHRAFLYSEGTFTDIGPASSPYTSAYDVNDAGQIVGTTLTLHNKSCRGAAPYDWHAFIYQNGVLTDLNTLLPPGSGWVLVYAFAINNNGHIVGAGNINGQLHAFMLRLNSNAQGQLRDHTRESGAKTLFSPAVSAKR